MCISKKICPVPFDQQPLNEYFSLRSSYFFSWSTLDHYKYIKKISYIFSFLFVLLIPIILSIVSNHSFMRILVLDIFIVNIILILIFVRLYLGWSYVVGRLFSATVFYEESGWYDGQIWIKSVKHLTKDRLVGLYQVVPFIQRIRYSLAVLVILMGLENLLYCLIK